MKGFERLVNKELRESIAETEKSVEYLQTKREEIWRLLEGGLSEEAAERGRELIGGINQKEFELHEEECVYKEMIEIRKIARKKATEEDKEKFPALAKILKALEGKGKAEARDWFRKNVSEKALVRYVQRFAEPEIHRYRDTEKVQAVVRLLGEALVKTGKVAKELFESLNERLEIHADKVTRSLQYLLKDLDKKGVLGDITRVYNNLNNEELEVEVLNFSTGEEQREAKRWNGEAKNGNVWESFVL